VCNNRIVTSDNNLTVTHPELIKEWHPTKNTLKPTEFGAGMSEKVKNDVFEAALWYIEDFDKWERGFLEDNLTLFNEGTYAIDMAEKWLQPYIVPSDLKTTQYSFPECSISD